jgi:hypothetical protein
VQSVSKSGGKKLMVGRINLVGQGRSGKTALVRGERERERKREGRCVGERERGRERD